MKKTFFILFLIIGCNVTLLGATYFVAQTAQGGGNGSSAGNAQSLAWANNTYAWIPGDTINLVGTFTNYLNAHGGTAGNIITIYFEPNANFTAGYWPPPSGNGGGAITIIGGSYITIDGGQNGLIQATNNGTTLGFQTNSIGIGAAAASYLTIKNLTIKGMYVRTSTTDEMNDAGIGIEDWNTAAPFYIANLTVSNCVIQDADNGIQTDFAPDCSNYTFTANTISRINWGVSCSDRQNTSTMTNLIFSNNNVSDFANWNDTAGNNLFHHNALHAYTSSGGTLTGIKCYGNTIGPNFGDSYSTSGFFYDSAGGTINYTWTYNNVFICATNDGCANGLITLSSGFNQIYNNTFICGGGGTGVFSAIDIGGNTATLKNNLIVNGPQGSGSFSIANDNSASGTNLTSDYNVVFNGGATPFSQSTSSSSSPLTFSQWQALGYDTHGTTNNPNLNGSYIPQPSSSAINAGANLTNLGIAGLDTDLAGNSRPETGAWTIGAYQYGSTPPPTPGTNDWQFLLVK